MDEFYDTYLSEAITIYLPLQEDVYHLSSSLSLRRSPLQVFTEK